ncbi:DUF1752-domain-containing protein [Parathielavia hyrcaniae]|uniref:DUF1752-domain-containing protein n=1 Tax=Parathielavia hyrcaniae TaxID=113614 RepID=A0AAN6QD11_9PEZI|nr:DUF1752-domain-containing protein [Parathielavia hyrcaniae]
MPLTLEAPVLQVDANVIHKVDTTNPANLFSMWTVFARCRDSVAQGRRLENLSWRLWNRETFCCEGEEMLTSPGATSQPQDIYYPQSATAEELPQLSGSVDSVADEEAVDMNLETIPVDFVRPRIQRQDSCASSRGRGRERHITSDELEKMVVSIMEAKTPLTAPLPAIPRSPEDKTSLPTVDRSGSTSSESPCESSPDASPESIASRHTPEPLTLSRTIVTRGFSPSQVPLSRITSPANKRPSMCAIPDPTDAPAPKIILPKKQQSKFVLGGSSGSDEESFKKRDLETRKPAAQPARRMFEIGGSSADESPEIAPPLQKTGPINGQKKTASFNNQLVTQTFASSAISDTEDDYLDESAIDDDDEEWEEESAEESGSSMGEDKLHFKRSTSALPRARPSLNGPTLVASPNDSDEAPLMMKKKVYARPPQMPAYNERPVYPQPINVNATGMQAQCAFSPRTTRRNMLATELPESLRRNLLRERSQRTATQSAALKRRHTSQDVANLKQYPEPPYMRKDKDVDNNVTNWDQYFKNPFAQHQTQAW